MADTGRAAGVLAGVRVLDFGRYVAGPVCAALLGDLGADVIRIERVGGAEDRGITPLAGDDGGALYMQANRNKRGMTLAPAKPAGQEVLRRLLATADVVVANLPEAALAAMGIDEPSVHAIRPDIVLATIDAFGPGPWAGRLGFDGIGQAMSGMAHLTGSPEQPLRAASLWVDYGTAALAAMGVLAGLLSRERGGGGEHVQTSLLHTAISTMGAALTEQAVTAPDRMASGNRGQTVGPADICATTDGWVVVQVVGNPMFDRFAAMVGRPELVGDPRFATDTARGDHRDAICDIAAVFCAARSTDEAIDAFDAAGLAAAPVLSPQEALDHPQVRAAGLLEPVPFPGVPVDPPIPTPPVRLAKAPSAITRRAPLLGEHTDELLAELGYDAPEVAALRASQVV